MALFTLTIHVDTSPIDEAMTALAPTLSDLAAASQLAEETGVEIEEVMGLWARVEGVVGRAVEETLATAQIGPVPTVMDR